MASSLFTVTLVLCTFLITIASVHAQSDNERLDRLQEVQQSKSSKLLTLSLETFRKYIEAAPRSYSMFVLFVAEANYCQMCQPMRAQWTNVAREYAALSSRQKASKPVFFAELKISPSDRQFLEQYHIEHVPILYYFPAGKSRRFPAPLLESSPDNYNAQQLGISANQLKDFVNKRCGSKMKVIKGGYQIPFVEPVKAWMPVILTFVALCAAIAVYSGLYKNPMMWYSLVVLVYIFSVGGGHYSWIHQSPLAAVNQNGFYEFIAGGARSQFVAEGFFVSATCVGISVLVILIQQLPKVIPEKSVQTGVGLLMVGMTIVLIVALLSLYTMVSFLTLLAPVISTASCF